MSSVLSDKRFHDEVAAYRFVEARVWPDGPICPHCGGVERVGKMGGTSPGSALTSATSAASPSP
jgi:hypothetical protein